MVEEAPLGSERRYSFESGYPSSQTVLQAYADADLIRAVESYRFFFPSVSGLAMFRGNDAVGLENNRVFGVLDTRPLQTGFTLNSDTPYGPIPLDLHIGPLVVELPPGPLLGATIDLHQRWVADMGIPGPDAGNGGRHLLLPPGWQGEIPDGYYVSRPSSYRVIVGVRSLPVGGDVAGAMERITTIKVHPLDTTTEWSEPTFLDYTDQAQDMTPLAYETSLEYWGALHEIVNSEPQVPGWEPFYGELAELGILAGQPFEPDERMRQILVRAAELGSGQLRVRAFADRRPDRVVWPQRQWQWASLRPENGTFDGVGYLDVTAREKWFYQAIAASPAMFRRGAGAGSVYWLGLRDAAGEYLDGGHTYELDVPQPVPARLFWSITVYDAGTRSQIHTDQGKAALRSLFELSGVSTEEPTRLRFGPRPPADGTDRWIQTEPGRGWFVYFRIYGPEEPAFDGSWSLPDFERTS